MFVVVFVLACWLSFKIFDQFPLEMKVSSLLHSGLQIGVGNGLSAYLSQGADIAFRSSMKRLHRVGLSGLQVGRF